MPTANDADDMAYGAPTHDGLAAALWRVALAAEDDDQYETAIRALHAAGDALTRAAIARREAAE